MPQLMPLMWINSIIISFLILFMLMDMFYYVNFKMINDKNNNNNNKLSLNLKW